MASSKTLTKRRRWRVEVWRRPATPVKDKWQTFWLRRSAERYAHTIWWHWPDDNVLVYRNRKRPYS